MQTLPLIPVVGGDWGRDTDRSHWEHFVSLNLHLRSHFFCVIRLSCIKRPVDNIKLGGILFAVSSTECSTYNLHMQGGLSNPFISGEKKKAIHSQQIPFCHGNPPFPPLAHNSCSQGLFKTRQQNQTIAHPARAFSALNFLAASSFCARAGITQ